MDFKKTKLKIRAMYLMEALYASRIALQMYSSITTVDIKKHIDVIDDIIKYLSYLNTTEDVKIIFKKIEKGDKNVQSSKRTDR